TGCVPSGYCWQACWSFTTAALNSGAESFQTFCSYANDPGTAPGNSDYTDWTMYDATGTTVIGCGNIFNGLNATGTACSTGYVLCLMTQGTEVAALNGIGKAAGQDSGLFFYSGYSSCSPPACSPLPI